MKQKQIQIQIQIQIQPVAFSRPVRFRVPIQRAVARAACWNHAKLPSGVSACLLLAASLVPWAAPAGTSSSVNYGVVADAVDAGGRRTTSALYRNDGSVGGVGGVSTAAVPAESARHGYAGQLYEVAAVTVSANPTNVNEAAARQLQARVQLDDGTVIVPGTSGVLWNVGSGPVQAISSSGLATAGRVFENTLATVQATFRARTGSLGLLVRNVGLDDYGIYAGDGLNDAWQVQHFGLNNPSGLASADPDADGQNNGYEETVGSIPTDGASYFRFRIEPVLGHADWMNLVFSPRTAGRTYTVQNKSSLTGGTFADLGPSPIADVGIERIVTDQRATGTSGFYRVLITKP